MPSYNERMQQYFEGQRAAFEPYRGYTELAVQAWERLARQNYALLGDYLDFAVDSAQLAARATDVQDYVGKRNAGTQAFGEKLASHAREYTEIVRSTRDAVANLVRNGK